MAIWRLPLVDPTCPVSLQIDFDHLGKVYSSMLWEKGGKAHLRELRGEPPGSDNCAQPERQRRRYR
jgi:hypothetical protein